MSDKFIGLEDEIQLRLSLRVAYKHEGIIGLYKIMGELGQSLEIVAEFTQEILEEEEKNKQ